MALQKASTGIAGFDEITGGGLPKGRPSLVCGGAGSGKTLFGIEFLVRGILAYGEPGVLITFEESADELIVNANSIGCNLAELIAQKKLVLDEVRISRNEIEETGAYDLEGLFIRLGYAIDSIGAKRVVLDTIEVLFSILSDAFTLRSEFQRLFRWLKDKGVTAVVTAEQGQQSLTRHGLEEYVSDCVILLDHRTVGQISTRRLRIMKYRGSAHGTNEYPFLIDNEGFTVLPITSIQLDRPVSDERVSSGIPGLDKLLGGQGYFRGSSIMIAGTEGTGKTSLACYFAAATCQRGERCLFFAMEESESQIVRNMRSIALELQPWIDKGNLRFSAIRPTSYGLETHLVVMYRLINDFQPSVVVLDPIISFIDIGTPYEVKAMLLRLLDYLKMHAITALITNLPKTTDFADSDVPNMSSMIDTMLLLRDHEANGERNRLINAVKSRGTAHSNQLYEFLLTNNGVDLLDSYIGLGGVLTGSSRTVRQLQEETAARTQHQEIENRKRQLASKRRMLEAQIAMLRLELEAETDEVNHLIAQQQLQTDVGKVQREAVAHSRGVAVGHKIE